MNTTGLELSESDKIRNYLMMKLDTEDQYTFHEKYWEPIEKLIKEETNDKTDVSSFIRHFLTLEDKKIPHEKKVYGTFKEYFNKKLEEVEKEFYYDKMLQTIQYMKELAELFVRFYSPKFEEDAEIRLHLQYISDLDFTVSYPFLMKVYHDYVNQKLTKTEFVEVLEILQSYFFRRFLLGKPSSVLNKVFMNLYDKVDFQNYANSVLKALSEKTGDAEFPTDKSVFKKLKEEKIFKSKKKYLNYLFTRLENHGAKNSKSISEHKNLSLGRIFPSKDSANWAQNLSEQELDQMLERCDTLANLAYSGCKDEKESFMHKKMMADNCYDQTSLWTNRYLKEIENWGLEELNKRHEILMERFFLVWKAPLEINKTANAEDNTLKNIFEIETATRKRVEKRE
jgi:hypothetical protein